MRFTVLLENSLPSAALNLPDGLVAAHGLSVALETDHVKIIADAGPSEVAWRNAELLGVDVHDADLVVISHGHYDHAGGVVSLLKGADRSVDQPPFVLLHKDASGKFFSLDYDHDASAANAPRFIGAPPELFDDPYLNFVDKRRSFTFRVQESDAAPETVAAAVDLFGDFPQLYPTPRANRLLKRQLPDGSLVDDSFSHELALLLRDGSRSLLYTGCAHSGIVNILEECQRLYGVAPDVVVGGFHLRRKNGYTASDLEEVRATADALRRYESTTFYTGHCTGDEPFALLRELLGEQIQRLYTGLSVDL